MVVEGEGDRRLAIELDGDAYHGPDVWARDMARQAALERAGWVFWRVFGSQWNQQKEYWWQNLLGTLDRMQIAPIGATPLDERFTETIEVDPRPDRDSLDGEGWEDALLSPGPEMTEEASPSSAVLPVTSNGGSDSPSVPAQPTPSGREDPAGAEPGVGTQTREPAAPSTLPDLIDPEEGKRELLARKKREIWPPRLDETPRPVSKGSPPAYNGAKARQASFDLPADDLFGRANGRSAKIAVGSTVLLQRIEDGSHFEITVVENQNDPDKSLVSIHAPLGEALIDAVEGDDVEYHVGSHTKEVRVLRVQ